MRNCLWDLKKDNHRAWLGKILLLGDKVNRQQLKILDQALIFTQDLILSKLPQGDKIKVVATVPCRYPTGKTNSGIEPATMTLEL
jgi:hypothetical protein